MNRPINIANELALLKEQAKLHFEKLLDTFIEIAKLEATNEEK